MASTEYPKSARLRLRRDFRDVLGHGRVYPGREVLVRITPNTTGRARLGIAAPARYGRAVRRNRFRRLVRAAFRHVQAELGAVDVMVTPRKGLAEPTLAGLTADLLAAPHKAHRPRPRRRS